MAPGKNEPRRYERELTPADYRLTIKTFDELKYTGDKMFETHSFDAGNESWRLCLYPNGKNKEDKDHISLYLARQNSGTNGCKEIHVEFKLFVLNQNTGKYLVVQDEDEPVKRFDDVITKWGFAQFISHEDFKSKGYLVDDCCVFGAEIFVINKQCKRETLSIDRMKGPGNSLTWKIPKISGNEDDPRLSDVFLVGKRKWRFRVFLKGDPTYLKAWGTWVSVYLELSDVKEYPNTEKVWADFKISAVYRNNSENTFKKGSHWFCLESPKSGFPRFMNQKLLSNKSLVDNDSVTIKVEILDMSTANVFI